MNVDWAVAIGVFVLFVGWSFIYYTGFFVERIDISQGLDSLSEKVLETLEGAEYRMPVRYSSPRAGQGVLYADLFLPGFQESQFKVLGDGLEQECMLSGDRLYWEDGLDLGENNFDIVYSDLDINGCDGSFSVAGANQTFPLSAVKNVKVSQLRLSELQAMRYEIFQQSMGIQNNVRVEWDGDLQGSFGPIPPGNRDVFVKETSRPLLEVTGTVNIRVFAWE
jgi:hypothetical protein